MLLGLYMGGNYILIFCNSLLGNFCTKQKDEFDVFYHFSSSLEEMDKNEEYLKSKQRCKERTLFSDIKMLIRMQGRFVIKGLQKT